MIRIVNLLVIVGAAKVGWAGNMYYVGVNGDDSNPGTLTRRWRTPQKCALPPVGPGDTCLVGPGTYTAAEAGSTQFVISISSRSASGTPTTPITIKSEFPLRARLLQTSVNGTGARTISVGQPGYVIEGFDIDGSMTRYGTAMSTSCTGIAVYASNVTVRGNDVHHIGHMQCSNSANSSSGVFTQAGHSNILIENNRISFIGRLRKGESGCVTDKYQHDHGIYEAGAQNVVIRNNLFMNNGRGFSIQVYKAAGFEHRNVAIHNNTFVGVSGQSSPTPSGQIVLANVLVNVSVQNNIFYRPTAGYGIAWGINTSARNLVVSHNLTDSSALLNPGQQPALSSTHNELSTSPGFVSVAAGDFRLAPGSAAIDSGIRIAGQTFHGTNPDKGAFEFGTGSPIFFRPPPPQALRIR